MESVALLWFTIFISKDQTRIDRVKLRNLEFGLLLYGLRMTQGYQLDHSLSQGLLKHKTFFDNVLLEHVRLTGVLPLAVHLFLCVVQVEGVILSHTISETAQSPNSSFPFLFDFGLGLGTWTHACQ